MSVTTQNIRWARLKLIKARRDYSKAIDDSRHAHGAWVEARDTTHNMPLRQRLYDNWKRSVAKAAKAGNYVSALSTYVNKGAQAASLDGAKAIAQWEGGRSNDGLFHPYQDPVGVWTIGYGHTAGVGPHSKPLTTAEAITLLLHDLNTIYAPAVRDAFKRNRWVANQKMFDAMTSFAYNLGPVTLSPGHDIATAMSHRSVGEVRHVLLRYDLAGDHVLPGLLRRRQWESQLFGGGHYSL